VSQEWWDSDILLLKKRITERITIEGDLVGILLSYTGLEYSLHTSTSYSEPSPHALCAAFAPEVVFRRRNIELKDPTHPSQKYPNNPRLCNLPAPIIYFQLYISTSTN
jgi:hypothetical protein